MRCGVRSCPLKSDWCWEGPMDKKHYKLRAPHIERLIDYVDGGGSLESHDDDPGDISRDLVLESQAGRKSKKANLSTTGLPYPPTIINVLPAQNGSLGKQLATDKAYKADFRRICQATLENLLDLELILEDPDAGFFVQQGIQIGTALIPSRNKAGAGLPQRITNYKRGGLVLFPGKTDVG
ncbi:hypothetical protein CNMCM5878_009255 [Aspergillus fumigatiaffinis]|nr:hypothetical protein CNMCM5878_009255 [Aspergillus fumigatiaffinis]KAF4217756.1 hypothetical protein CNMCM6457_004267 [Aspergillus fumigatiaffinis]